MNKYHFNIRLNNVRYNHAGSKAVEDCKAILLANGFEDIEISFVKKGYLMPFNLIKLLFSLFIYSSKIKPNSLVLVQYPLLGINRYFKYFASKLKAKQCHLVCLIHDLDAVRSESKDDNAIRQELQVLSVYDTAIAHNEAMRNWLVQNGYKGKIVTIELFDYLTNEASKQGGSFSAEPEVLFAGSLSRGKFINHLHNVKNVAFKLYGPGFDAELLKTNPNVKWMGSFSPDEIVRELEGNFGLIWDGTSIETCTGVMGNYLQYNTPHKTSLYLVCGLPVIIPLSAAMAKYVTTNKIGIAVNSLSDLAGVLSGLTQEQYLEMKGNALHVSTQLKQGYFLMRAVDEVMERINNT
jgi:hypothetical protein